MPGKNLFKFSNPVKILKVAFSRFSTGRNSKKSNLLQWIIDIDCLNDIVKGSTQTIPITRKEKVIQGVIQENKNILDRP